jgi:hypothetical protein
MKNISDLYTLTEYFKNLFNEFTLESNNLSLNSLTENLYINLSQTAADAENIYNYFSLMLSATEKMLTNIQSAGNEFSLLAADFINLFKSLMGFSYTSNSAGLIGSVFGKIFSLFSGGLFGLNSFSNNSNVFNFTPLRFSSQSLNFPNLNNQNISEITPLLSNNPQIINQITIKNPVTFSNALEAELKTRTIRGGIEL